MFFHLRAVPVFFVFATLLAASNLTQSLAAEPSDAGGSAPGMTRESAGALAAASGPGQSQAAAASSYKICPVCGRRMPASFNFCGNCGANLQNVRAVVAATTVTAEATASFSAPAPTPAPPEKKRSSLLDFFFPSSGGEQGSALSDQPIPMKTQDFPDRPKPLIEIGQNPFLSPGLIGAGFVSPTGAVWTPEFLVYGTARLAWQTFDDGLHHQITELATRLDIFGNLYLTPTERFLIGFRPLDRQAGNEYSGYRFEPEDGPQNDINAYVTTFFFEGGLASLFPKLDPNGDKSLDYNFSIGRQPFNFQDGIMINDDLDDAIGVNRTSLFALGASAVRTTAIAILHDMHRNDNLRDDHAALYGVFTTADYAKSTVDFDLSFVSADSRTGGDGFYVGLGSTQRLGLINSTFRVNSSVALDRDTPAVSTGTLLLSQFSLTIPDRKDIAYLDLFWAIDQYASAARGPDLGGPLSSIGLLFAAQGLGAYGAPIGDQADNSVGAAIGYQKFIGGTEKQLTLELGGRIATSDYLHFSKAGYQIAAEEEERQDALTPETDAEEFAGDAPETGTFAPEQPPKTNVVDNEPSAIGLASRYQMKLNQHEVLILDAFVAFPEYRSTAYGFRSELLLKF